MRLFCLLALFGVCTALSHPGLFGHGSHRIATQLMIDVAAHQYECFFQNFTQGSEIQIFGRLMDREGLWMIMQFSSPSGTINDYQKTRDKVEYKVTAPDTGDYKLCVTSNSPYGPTRIILEIFAFHPDEFAEVMKEEKDRVVQYRDMKNCTNNLFTHTWKAFYHLKFSNAKAMTDTYAQERNRQYIDNFSFFQCTVILSCAFIQVFVIRKFFAARDGKRPYA
uniref:GOLD domain-containing protein n=1 Tax=Plectus sambesii TaxID=2011161 RepID=A0A914ULQ5_9BILA